MDLGGNAPHGPDSTQLGNIMPDSNTNIPETFESTFNVSPEEGASSKKVTVNYNLAGKSLADILAAAEKTWRIQLQGQLRKAERFNSLVDGGTIEFTPGSREKAPPKVVMTRELSKMTDDEERVKFLKETLADLEEKGTLPE